MSKIKLSFSLIIALLLVGIMSTAVFASSAYGLKVGPDGSGGFKVTFKRIADTETSFTVSTYKKDTITNEFTVAAKDYPVTVADSNTVTVYIPSSDVTVGTPYKVVLKNASGEVSIRYAVLTAPEKVKMATDPSELVDVNGSGLVNSNHTGADAVKKTGQKTHGFYQNNTNSCASCHQTHTAADGEYLLFKDGTYSTCSACHDGTTGAYNSFEPVTNVDPNKDAAGTFNVSATGHNGSMHVADGSLQVSAAPGGNNATPSTDSKTVNANTWGSEFDCASCHTPHGAGSAGENNLALDPLGWGGVQYYAEGATKKDGSTATKDDTNGKLFKDLQVKQAVPSDFSTPYILVRTTATDAAKNYWWNRAGVKEGDPIIQTYRWDGTKYVADYSLWLRDVGHKSAPFQNANTVLKDTTGNDITANTMTVIWRDGFAFGSGVNKVTIADLSIGIDVETTSDVASLFDSKNANYIPDSGTEMSKYCASCHVDYLSTTRGNNTGVYTVAHRHATAQDRLSCVRCHYGHGTEAQIMKDANDTTYADLTTTFGMTSNAAISYLVDPNPSSAIKRYTGMSVCYACHGKGEDFLGNPNTNTDSKTHAVTGPWLKNGDPGAARTDLTTRH